MNAPATAPARTGTARTATLCSTASDEAATALMPAFLAGTLAASPIALGVVEGLAALGDGAARLAGGALAENPKRRGWISAGSYAVMALLTGLVAVSASAVQVGVLRGGSAVARGLRSPQRYASVPERVAADGYGRAFGFERGMHHLASVGGPLLAFAVLAVAGVRSALLAAVVPGLLATVVGIVLLRRRGRAAPAAAQAPGRARLRVREVYSGPLGRLMSGITLFELANFAAVLLVLRATKLLERQDVPFGPAATAVLLYLLWRLAAAAASPPSGRWVDRAGPLPVMAAGVFALLTSYAGFAFAEGTAGQLALCFAAAGAAGGAIEAAEHVGVARTASQELRWSAFGSLSAVRSFGRMTATIGATVVWELLGPAYGLMLATPFMVAALAVMARGHGRRIVVAALVTVLVAALVVALPILLALLLAASGAVRGYG